MSVEPQPGGPTQNKRYIPDKPDKEKPCHHWMKGDCRFGNSCRYRHEEGDKGRAQVCPFRSSSDRPDLVLLKAKYSKGEEGRPHFERTSINDQYPLLANCGVTRSYPDIFYVRKIKNISNLPSSRYLFQEWLIIFHRFPNSCPRPTNAYGKKGYQLHSQRHGKDSRCEEGREEQSDIRTTIMQRLETG